MKTFYASLAKKEALVQGTEMKQHVWGLHKIKGMPAELFTRLQAGWEPKS